LLTLLKTHPSRCFFYFSFYGNLFDNSTQCSVVKLYSFHFLSCTLKLLDSPPSPVYSSFCRFFLPSPDDSLFLFCRSQPLAECIDKPNPHFLLFSKQSLLLGSFPFPPFFSGWTRFFHDLFCLPLQGCVIPVHPNGLILSGLMPLSLRHSLLFPQANFA